MNVPPIFNSNSSEPRTGESKRIDRRAILGLLSVTKMTGATKIAPATTNRRRALRWLAPLLLLALCAPTLHAGLGKALKHERHHEIDQLEQAWCTAVLHGDATALGNLLADDYISITAKGMLQTKAQALENLRTRKTQIVTLDLSDRKVRFYGFTAVVTSLARVEGTKDNEDISGSFRYTHVYVRNPAGLWKLVSAESSRIPVERASNR
jgi:ketosteroid isomerase-like protein